MPVTRLPKAFATCIALAPKVPAVKVISAIDKDAPAFIEEKETNADSVDATLLPSETLIAGSVPAGEAIVKLVTSAFTEELLNVTVVSEAAPVDQPEKGPFVNVPPRSIPKDLAVLIEELVAVLEMFAKAEAS